MQEKIIDEWDKPSYVTLGIYEYQKIKENILIYEITIKAIKEELEDEEHGLENIKRIIKEFEDEIEK